MSAISALEHRIAKLEAESQIRQLVANYCFYIDNREIDRIGSLFTEDACLRSADGVMNATGVDSIVEQFLGRFDALGPGHHFMHDIQLNFVSDEQEAVGCVAGHAELWRNGKMMVTALRYHDRYRNTRDGWRIAEREINFLYYVPLADYPGILGTPDRNHANAKPTAADFPEKLPSWLTYTQSRDGN